MLREAIRVVPPQPVQIEEAGRSVQEEEISAVEEEAISAVASGTESATSVNANMCCYARGCVSIALCIAY